MSQTKTRNSHSQVCYNIAVVGGGAVGKSALTIQFVQRVFCEEYDPTIEDQHRKQVVIDEECCVLEILDTAGQEELIPVRDQYFRSGEGFLLVFSLCSQESFIEIKTLYEKVLRAKDSDCVPVVIVGNKCDLRDARTVPQQDIDDFMSSMKDPSVKYLEASAKDRTNVDEGFHEVIRIIRKKDAPKEANKQKIKKKIKSNHCNLL